MKNPIINFVRILSRKLTVSFLLALVLSSCIALRPITVYAEGKTKDDLTKRVKNILMLGALEICVDKLGGNEVRRGNPPFNNGTPGSNAGERRVGHINEQENGIRNCSKHPDQFFKLLLQNGETDKYYSGWYEGSSRYANPDENPRDNVRWKSKDNTDVFIFINSGNRPPKENTNTDPITEAQAKSKMKSQINRSITKNEEGLSSDDKTIMKFLNYQSSFTHGCNAKKMSAETSGGKSVKVGDVNYTVSDLSGLVSVGPGWYGEKDDSRIKCDKIAKFLGDNMDLYKKYFNITGDVDMVTGSQSDDSEEEPTCRSEARLSSAWLVCSMTEFLSDKMDTYKLYVDSLLDVDVAKMDAQSSSSGSLKASWGLFRGVASFLLLAVGILMVLSQAIGGGS